MRQVVIVSLMILVLSAGTAHAQSSSYAAVSVGFPLLVNVHYGLEDVFAPGADLRLNLGGLFLAAGGEAVFYGVAGADVLYRFNHEDAGATLSPYAGGGIGVAFAGFGGGGADAVGFAFNGSGVVGLEHRAGDTGFFAEARLNVSAAGGGVLAWPNIGIGASFRL